MRLSYTYNKELYYCFGVLQRRLEELHRLWDLLLQKLRERRIRLEQAQKLVEFMRQYEDMMFWIRDREAFLSSDDVGRDLEHVEVMQRKFEDFQKVCNSSLLG